MANYVTDIRWPGTGGWWSFRSLHAGPTYHHRGRLSLGL